MAKLSKSREDDRVDLILELAEEFTGDSATVFANAATVVNSDWLAEVRSASFWAGVKALAELTGVELDDYTRASIVDPYEENK